MFGFTEFGELFCDVLHGTVVLAKLNGVVRRSLYARGESVFRQQIGQLRSSLCGGGAGDRCGVPTFGDSESLPRILGNEVLLRLGCHEPQRAQCDVVVHLIERIPASCGKREHLRGPTATAWCRRSGSEGCFLVRTHERSSLKCVEVSPNGSRREREFGCKLGCARRTAFKQSTRDPRCSTSDFHNVIVT